jgi:hypothetical protein
MMSNMEYSVAEAKKHFSELLSRVAFRGEHLHYGTKIWGVKAGKSLRPLDKD